MMMNHDHYKQISIKIISHRSSVLLHFEVYRKRYLIWVDSSPDILYYPCDQLVEVHLENILFFSSNPHACNLYTILFYIYRISQFSWDDDYRIQNICQFPSDIFLPLCIFSLISHIFQVLFDIYHLLSDTYLLILSIFINLLALSIYLDDRNLFFYLYHICHIFHSLFYRLFYPYDNDHTYHLAPDIFFHHIRDHEYLFRNILFCLCTYHLDDNNLSIYILFFIFPHSFYFYFFLSFHIYQTLYSLSSLFYLACEEISLGTYHHSYQKNNLNISYRHSSSFQYHHIFWRLPDHPSTYHNDSYDNAIVLYSLPFHTRP